MTDCARLKTTVRRCIMRPDIRDSLKLLRLNGMVMAWEELTENGGSNRIENSKWQLEHLIEAEDTNRAMRSIVHQMKAAKFPLRRDLAGFAKRFCSIRFVRLLTCWLERYPSMIRHTAQSI
jgi:hypothetical protein